MGKKKKSRKKLKQLEHENQIKRQRLLSDGSRTFGHFTGLAVRDIARTGMLMPVDEPILDTHPPVRRDQTVNILKKDVARAAVIELPEKEIVRSDTRLDVGYELASSIDAETFSYVTVELGKNKYEIEGSSTPTMWVTGKKIENTVQKFVPFEIRIFENK